MSDSTKGAKHASGSLGESSKPAPKKRKWPIVLGVIVIVIVVAGIGFWNWHNQPSFCNAFCHTSMDSYVATYDQPVNQQGTDKYGNAVSNTHAMMVVSHKEAGMNCLSCHVPTLSQQLGEVKETITGDYYYPLDEVSDEELMVNSGHEEGSGDQFCLRSGCHEMTRADLTEATSGMAFNPHNWQHGNIACSECHKSHRASVFYCTQCHTEAEGSMPDGWVTYAEGQKALASAYAD